ncbi:uncharacterized protein Dwil_GK14739 [Drosophila willistoni]|uniref:UDP-glucuronosyltransferase n=1 Tax=Drosophila willistoni TaxID=7260 RepID=B4MUU5_DROWI|nr:uncharacterized protein Dwil_GK14739 [Drosophila willistoni]
MKQVLLLLLGLISTSQSANILGIFTCPMPSHSIVQMSVAKALAEKGHNVTILTTVDPVIKHKNFNVIHIPLSPEDARYFKELFGSLGKTDTDGVLGSIVANPRELSYVPAMNVGVEKGAIMTFSQRIKTLAMSWGYRLWDAIENVENKKRYNFLYGDDPTMPRFEDLPKNISLMFFNSHGLSEGPIRPNLPGVIEIGGIQIKDTPDPLPKNIAEFLDDAREGAILLSLGSNIQSDHLQSDTVKKMFSVLSKLKLKVIWKWDKLEHIPGNSSNILYSKWLPQDDILAHPNIKLFITHAGRGGISEASYHGKPMLALPMFGDQQGNAGSMVKQGFGLSLKLLELKEKTFQNTINEILQNSQYKENVENFSKLYRDRPLTARQSVIYWTEYVMRYHGAKHLQSPLVHMDFIAANNLDIYGILGVSVAFVLYLIYLFLD